ncbi:hypothetical protein LCGC14_0598550 [marine sediment metagenome]|uniref:Uncharacterized protein n=1 Tax=marine sediment metagenome TaxID=412755 RepID=A0A0F9RG83_9ZZZZ
MPVPYTSFNIGIKASTTLTQGEYAKVTNLTRGGTIRGQANSNGEVVLNPASSKLAWQNGDKLSIEISGVTLGSASVTITRGGTRKTVTVTTIAGPTVSI